MKKNYFLKTCMLIMCLFVGMSAWADNVELSSFDAVSGDMDSYISYEAAKGTASTAPAINSGEIRVYQNGGTFTVTTSSAATINEIVLGSSMATKVTYAVDGGAASSSQNITADGKLTVSGISATSNVLFTCMGTDKNSRLYVNYLKVTYTVKTPTTTYTVTLNAGANGTCSTASIEESAVGSGVVLPACTPNEGYTFLGWSETEGAKIADATAGETYKLYSDGTLYAVYGIARPANEVFYESFDTNNGTGGNDGLWSGSIASSTIKYDNSGWTVASGNGASECAKFGAGSAQGSATTPAISASGNLTLTFKAAAWNGNSEGTTLNLSATGATLSESSVTLVKGEWTEYTVDITNATEGFKITFKAAKSSNNRFFLDEVSICKATTAKITLNAACTDGEFVYGTYSNSSAWVVPADLIVSEIAIIDDELCVESYNEGDVVPANTGVMVSATEGGDYTVELSSETGTSVLCEDNALCPSSKPMEGDNLYYRLTMHNGETIGYYWGAEDGAAFSIAANKAYLAVPASAAASVRMWIGGETAIKTVENNAQNGAIYNLAGQRVNNATKGIYIQNGKKYIK